MQDIQAQDLCLPVLASALDVDSVLAKALALAEDLVSEEASDAEEVVAGGAQDTACSGDSLILR